MPKKRRYYKGKRVSKGEKRISEILDELQIEFESQKTFERCLSPKQNRLRFDFYLPEYNILIEYQGQHHYKPVNKYRRAKRVHDQTKIHDNIKRNFVLDNKIDLILIEIPYWDFDNLYDILYDRLVNTNANT